MKLVAFNLKIRVYYSLKIYRPNNKYFGSDTRWFKSPKLHICKTSLFRN